MSNSSKLSIFVLSGLSLAISGVTTAYADEPSDEVNLEMIQVVGQATGGVDDVITLDHLEKVQATDLNDIFASDAQVGAGGGVALGQKIYVRNIGEDMLNITVDGASQAGGVFHHAGRVVIDPDLLKQVEVETGAGSATAGLGALGGAVKFVTKDPEDFLRGDETVGATLKSTYYSNGESLKHSATVYGADDRGKFSGLANIISADLNNTEDGSGEEIEGSESNNTVGFAKVIANITDSQTLSVSYESLNQEGDILFRPEWIPSIRNPIIETEANRETIIANYGFISGSLIDLSVNVSQNQVELIQGEDDDVEGKSENIGLNIENTTKLGSHKLIYGANYREDKADLIESDVKLGEEEGEIVGLYIQDIITVGKKLTLAAGLRYDSYTLDNLNDNEFSDSGVAPNLSANFSFTPELSFSAGYAEAIRGVTVSDSYTLYEGSYTYDEDLTLERARNLELAGEFNRGPLSVGAGVYKSIIDDPIEVSFPKVFSDHYENGDDIETIGYYLKAGFAHDGLNIDASFHSADTKQDKLIVTRYQHSSSATSIGDTLVLDLKYQLNSAWVFGWTSQFVADIGSSTYEYTFEGAPETVTVEKKGYSVHDTYAQWSPMIDDTLVLTLTVKNVFDRDYLNQASPEDLTHNVGYEIVSGQNDPGRDIRLSAAVKF